MQSEQTEADELEVLLNVYRRRYPHAEDPMSNLFGFGPCGLLSLLREAQGREIVFSYPGLEEGVLDGCTYHFKEAPRPVLSLQELLYYRGLPPQARTKLVRHRDTSGALDVHEVYRNRYADFLDYQRQQGNPIFHKCDYVVACLGESGSQARFVGVYRVLSVERETDEHYYYQLTEVPGFEELKDRVLIEWGKAALSWHQWLRPDTPKVVLEIQPKPFSRPFTDYLDFTLSFAELQELVGSQSPRDDWRRMLSAVAGIYLILDSFTGQQYIGSAYGEGGVWQRWSVYAKTNGHGNNVALRSLLATAPDHARHFQFTLLMTLPKSMTDHEVWQHEKLFKRKLGSRAFGLNLN
ncbi:GIY-YIG nuclease family protein [Hymenobacter perfusus]|uniref:GIY-YIG nuclease family protein n=1 Tax=Hymenobacter perfusus TaxID=1236770 RepID=A0A3R9NW70_9BACT|nr:GIY-YIG nuclease family protein [Hymenobacter perfusus]RSK38964.1 GIY-YIG nuclease family protein [Hymenobacter perfusus]